ncbi:uncharacterized protein LOC109112334 isoform X2 [Cyprinus carpio]|uniref:Uncharacterized protein LOC109112334 isoform X1 n=1 Tax=Cyprinus carpio TaxID=7962 RepID=A0A9R0AKQ4_CYPCA|nr:uncharacterized protein LOC109112334 isoform X1 [Cyprinus carpio]XP_042602395.1 uncharacterized protein LOC109112334 isoform X2 [Cyprinus carpio]
MLRLLLLLWVSNYIETIPIHVAGKKGGGIILPCEFKAREIFHIRLNRPKPFEGEIFVYDKKYCSKRICKKGACDVVIKDLRLSDAGKYILNVYYNNANSVLEPHIRTYQLHIYDEICVNIGEQLKLDVLLSEADKVQHQSRRSTEWMKVWSRSDGVQSQPMTIRDRNLIISNFTARDTGSYRVLDPSGETLITVTVRESGTEAKGKLETNDDKPNALWICLLASVLPVCLCFWFWWFWKCYRFESSIKYQRLHRNVEHGSKGSQFNKL